MQPMTVTEIAAVVSGVWWNPCEQVPAISAVSTDSRNITPGCLFLPWVGEQFRSEERRVGKECRSRWSPYH